MCHMNLILNSNIAIIALDLVESLSIDLEKWNQSNERRQTQEEEKKYSCQLTTPHTIDFGIIELLLLQNMGLTQMVLLSMDGYRSH